jgi:hypothetical protein
LSCIAQRIHVNLEFEGNSKITRVHSKYKYEPNQLPSRRITLTLKDLNADEQRNMIFQLCVPTVNEGQSTEILSQEAMSHNQIIGEYGNFITKKYHLKFFCICLGHVSTRYIEPGSGLEIITPYVPFRLIRASELSPDLLQINHKIDLQRNRVETAAVLKQAMDESDYNGSLDLLKVEVDKIKASVSAQDPFCQQLIKDLRCRYTVLLIHSLNLGLYFYQSQVLFNRIQKKVIKDTMK